MPLSVSAQQNADGGIPRLLNGVEYAGELNGMASGGDHAPFWLTSNQHGLVSVENYSSLLRGSLIRPIETDSMRKWRIGFGVDAAVGTNYTSTFMLQQLYGEAQYKAGRLTIGAKERPMELKNNELSTGSQTLGINARPIPQIRLELPDWWQVPLTRGWLQFKGHISYGRFTDDHWQHEFTHKQERYADNTLYNSKAGFLRVGKDDGRHPLSVEFGLEMATQFGGTTYERTADGTMQVTHNSTNFKAFWNALIPGGADAYESEFEYSNYLGNSLGSYLLRINFDKPTWHFSLYADHFFEDHSAMLMVDYNGYGTGNQWNRRDTWTFLLYDFKDMLLGGELLLKRGTWVRNIVAEYIYSKYQSGPVYHDHNPGASDHIAGMDNYYNHNLYAGWQHWGQVIGNPLYQSPIYNTDGKIVISNNRFMAFHIGLGGQPTPELSYRLLATWRDGLGTYIKPYTRRREQVNIMAEANYAFRQKSLKGWSVGFEIGYDNGDIVGNNFGGMLKIKKTGLLRTQ